jgi:B9 domain-containing protein 1
MMKENDCFYLQCVGQIESGDLGIHDFLYCKYSFQLGYDWSVTSGPDVGISQVSCKSPADPTEKIVWNFPIDLTFESTNVFGWPRIAISVHGVDFFGNDVIRGYGSALLPMSNGNYQLEVDLYSPLATSYMSQLISWFVGNPPEVLKYKKNFLVNKLSNKLIKP